MPKLPNNLVLSDISNGSIVICNHDSVVALNSKNNAVSKFLVTVKPKLLCLTSIYPDPLREGKNFHYKLVDTCVISSPASQLLSTSSHLLMTVQNDQDLNSEIKLWSQSDGRCIMTSPKNLFLGKTLIRIVHAEEFNMFGYVVCISKDGWIFVVNVYTMNLHKKFKTDLDDVH